MRTTTTTLIGVSGGFYGKRNRTFLSRVAHPAYADRPFDSFDQEPLTRSASAGLLTTTSELKKQTCAACCSRRVIRVMSRVQIKTSRVRDKPSARPSYELVPPQEALLRFDQRSNDHDLITLQTKKDFAMDPRRSKSFSC